MKKVKLYPTLVLSFILSSLAVTSSALEETFTYGTRPTTWSGVPITGAGDAPRTGGSSNGGSSYTPPEARAAIAAQQKAAYEGQKAYCKANNYPTNVPFCAGFKKQEIQKQCAAEKGRIESENSGRLSGLAGDNRREIGRCNSQSNTGWSGSVSGGHPFLMFGVTHTVENPSYDKCVNAVSASYEEAKADVHDIYTRDKNTARSAMNAQCADFFM